MGNGSLLPICSLSSLSLLLSLTTYTLTYVPMKYRDAEPSKNLEGDGRDASGCGGTQSAPLDRIGLPKTGGGGQLPHYSDISLNIFTSSDLFNVYLGFIRGFGSIYPSERTISVKVVTKPLLAVTCTISPCSSLVRLHTGLSTVAKIEIVRY